MKIIETSGSKKIQIKDVPPGEVFIHEGRTFMKCRWGDSVLVVDLSLGVADYFNEKIEVEILEAEVTIKGVKK